MSKENDDDRFGFYGSKKAAADWEWQAAVQGLGLVSIEFQRLESLIKIAICELVVKTDQLVGALITAELSFKAASHLLYALAEYRWKDPAAANALDKILGRCDQAEGKRNQVIHSDWFPDRETGKGAIRYKSTARNRKGLRIQIEPATPGDMKKLAEELKRCRRDLWNLLKEKLPDLKAKFAGAHMVNLKISLI